MAVGGRLTAAGVDTTFLVRDRRAGVLAQNGLVIKSDLGDLTTPVRTITSATAAPGYDAILLSCKAYDLDDAIESIRPAAPGALIIPLLNGMRQLDALDAAFGATNVAGGVAAIFVTLDDDGTIRHFGKGQLNGSSQTKHILGVFVVVPQHGKDFVLQLMKRDRAGQVLGCDCLDVVLSADCHEETPPASS